MPQIEKNKIWGILFLVGLLVATGCAEENTRTAFNENGHAKGWVLEGHDTAAQADQGSCTACHGTELTGGISGVSCSDCHMGGSGSVHPESWGGDANSNHRDYVLLNSGVTGSCSNANCHGADFKGVAGSGSSCTLCHPQVYYDCTACHLQPPSTGRHASHMSRTDITCSSCHVVTFSTHDNGTKDLISSISYSSVTGQCSSPGCHDQRSW